MAGEVVHKVHLDSIREFAEVREINLPLLYGGLCRLCRASKHMIT